MLAIGLSPRTGRSVRNQIQQRKDYFMPNARSCNENATTVRLRSERSAHRQESQDPPHRRRSRGIHSLIHAHDHVQELQGVLS